nr:MAG TPA: hypothetical protein [Caudoviricetes sp.]
MKECVQKNALFFYICLGYPIKSGNDRERKGEPLCVNKAVFLCEIIDLAGFSCSQSGAR